MTVAEFVEKFCVGQRYDSYKESPCRFSSADGCRHPLHPKNQKREPIPGWAADSRHGGLTDA